jgi:hypothetical protein
MSALPPKADIRQRALSMSALCQQETFRNKRRAALRPQESQRRYSGQFYRALVFAA